MFDIWSLEFKLPTVAGRKIKEVRILPRYKALWFEIEYVYVVLEATEALELEATTRSAKNNSMIHNFWSHRYRYLIKRIKEKAEEYGIKVTEVNESYTSSVCRDVVQKTLKRERDCSKLELWVGST